MLEVLRVKTKRWRGWTSRERLCQRIGVLEFCVRLEIPKGALQGGTDFLLQRNPNPAKINDCFLRPRSRKVRNF